MRAPAEKGGIKVGDHVASLDGREVKSVRTYLRLVKKLKPGKVVKLKIKSGEEEKEVELKAERI